MEHHTLPIDQFWPLMVNRLLQTVELRTVENRIEGLAIVQQLIVDDSFPIPPNTQQNLPGRQSGLGDGLGRLTALRPRSFPLDVVVRDPLFITSHHPLQKWVEFVPFQQRIAGVYSVQEFLLRQLVWYPNIHLLFL